MPDCHVTFGNNQCAWITMQGEYKPGDPPPVGLLDRYDWAEVQLEAGLKQVCCGVCGRWKFPQELDHTDAHAMVGYRSQQDALAGENPQALYVPFPVCKVCFGTAADA